MDKQKLKMIVEKNKKWCFGKEDGEKADLHGADLHGADLCCADLRGADLKGIKKWKINTLKKTSTLSTNSHRRRGIV